MILLIDAGQKGGKTRFGAKGCRFDRHGFPIIPVRTKMLLGSDQQLGQTPRISFLAAAERGKCKPGNIGAIVFGNNTPPSRSSSRRSGHSIA
jgi:hypothetical protein